MVLDGFDQAVQSALRPADAELTPVWSRRGNPVVGNHNRHPTESQRLVHPYRRRSRATRAEHETRSPQHVLEPVSASLEVLRRGIVEREVINLFNDRIGVSQLEQ